MVTKQVNKVTHVARYIGVNEAIVRGRVKGIKGMVKMLFLAGVNLDQRMMN